MFENFQSFIVYSLLFIMVMLFAEITYRILKIPAEWTRKLTHILSGIIVLSYPIYIKDWTIVFLLSVSFTFFLLFSKKQNWFRSIFNVERKSYGDLFFIWSAFFLYLVFFYTKKPIYFYLPFSILVFADSLAAIIGIHFPYGRIKIFKNKTLCGSITFFVTAFILSYINLIFLHSQKSFLVALFLSFILTITEMFSLKGWDNLTIPLITVILILII